MKTRTRIATALSAVMATLFFATPAFASEGNDADSMFSSVNHHMQVGHIITVGVILLIIVLALSIWLGSLFNDSKKQQ